MLPFSPPALKSFDSSYQKAATFKQEMIFYALASFTYNSRIYKAGGKYSFHYPRDL